MKPSELERIYAQACATKGFQPSDGQFKTWKQVLGWCEAGDLAQALIWWWESETDFPMPVELKHLAGRAMRERLARDAEPKDYCHWECPVCGFTMSGFIPPSDIEPRACRSCYAPKGTTPRCLPMGDMCGAIMEVVERRPMEQGKGAISA
jgi:hypothetical protein